MLRIAVRIDLEADLQARRALYTKFRAIEPCLGDISGGCVDVHYGVARCESPRDTMMQFGTPDRTNDQRITYMPEMRH